MIHKAACPSSGWTVVKSHWNLTTQHTSFIQRGLFFWYLMKKCFVTILLHLFKTFKQSYITPVQWLCVNILTVQSIMAEMDNNNRTPKGTKARINITVFPKDCSSWKTVRDNLVNKNKVIVKTKANTKIKNQGVFKELNITFSYGSNIPEMAEISFLVHLCHLAISNKIP